VECPAAIESQCPYSAIKIYLRDRLDVLDSWPANVLTVDTTPKGVEKALKEGPYGRCVYACDNNVCDHQIVNLEFENGATIGFATTAFASGGRDYYVMGDKGTLRFTGEAIVQHDFLTGNDTTHEITSGDSTILSGHGGGDAGIMKSFLGALRDDANAEIRTGPEASLESHLIVFAAEKARKNGEVQTITSI
jgi:predicted dehydrogenase